MDAFVGEIRVFPYSFVPKNWAACNGALMQIRQSSALFSILGIQFGGDGSTTFALPDYRGFIPVSIGSTGGNLNWVTGMTYGSNSVTLTQDEMPMHNHAFDATTASATTNVAAGNQLGVGVVGRSNPLSAQMYSTGGVDTQLGGSIQPTGGNAAHNNQMPSLGLQICICLVGTYPVRG